MTLGNVCEIIMGQAPAGTAYNDTEQGVPLLAGAGDLGEIYPNPSRHTTEASKLSQLGDIIICIRATIGTKNWADRVYCLGRGVAALRPKDPKECFSKFLWHWLSANEQALLEKGRGATFLQVSKADIEELPCILPLPAEQRRIAAILDKADAICRKRQEALKLADAFVKSVFLDMFGDPVLNPKGWKYSTFKECSVRLSDGPFGSNLKSEHYVSAGIRVVRLQNIGSGNFIDKDKAYISQNHYQKLSKYTCRPGDILVGTLGEPNLRACIVPSDIEISINKADCVHYIPKKDTLVGEFVCQYINMPATLAFAVDKFHGQTRTRISSGQFACLPLPLPPLPLQNRFAEIVQRVEAHKQRLKAHLSEAEQMKKALQQQFFG